MGRVRFVGRVGEGRQLARYRLLDSFKSGAVGLLLLSVVSVILG